MRWFWLARMTAGRSTRSAKGSGRCGSWSRSSGSGATRRSSDGPSVAAQLRDGVTVEGAPAASGTRVKPRVSTEAVRNPATRMSRQRHDAARSSLTRRVAMRA